MEFNIISKVGIEVCFFDKKHVIKYIFCDFEHRYN